MPRGLGLLEQRDESPFYVWILVSIGTHIGTIIGIGLAYLAYLGIAFLLCLFMSLIGVSQQCNFWKVPLFNSQMKPRDVEFVLVDNTPKAQPRKPTTKRAEHASRSGGEKIPNQPEQMPQRAAGKPSPRSQPRAAVKPQPQAKQQVARTTPKQSPQKPSPKPSPPAPKIPVPQKVASAAPSLPPNPIAPVKIPVPSNPRVAPVGPVAKTSSSSTSSSSSGSGGPTSTMISGTPSRSGSGSPGSAGRTGGGGGSGGTGAYNQSGSPGGGGGRAGIDAMEEPDFGPYIAELQRRIRRNWSPPVEDRSKRVVALFKISRDGRLLSLRIQQSSGSQPADNAAMAAVRASAPFRPLPPNYRSNDIDVQFIFDYEIYGHGSAKMH